MKAVSVLEHFSDHDSIHQKLKKNTASVYSIAQLGRQDLVPLFYSTPSVGHFLKSRIYSDVTGLRYIVQPCLLFTTPAFFVTLSSLVPSFFPPVVARSSSLSRLLFDLLPATTRCAIIFALRCGIRIKAALHAIDGAADISTNVVVDRNVRPTARRKLYDHSLPCRAGVERHTLTLPLVAHCQFTEFFGARRSTASEVASL
ncbi:hypothetical protein TNCV_1930471 [Trichonephila clavipes]|nr:hypothetical protein TNCV_1930471 [Trichonephila clavipes]